MTARVRISGDRVSKSLGGCEAVRSLLRRTALLQAAGVPTPTAHAGQGPGVVSFDRIVGEDGLTAILTDGEAALGDMIGALAVLHGARIPDLSPFDPLLRIRPRLTTPVARVAQTWAAEWIARYLPPPQRDGVVHGDFHAGQAIRDLAGKMWILDLDDLALGPCEADLGNFAAHLATRPETRGPDVMAAYRHWLDRVLRHYPGARPDLADRYGRIALLRRALKLTDKGDEDVLVQLRMA